MNAPDAAFTQKERGRDGCVARNLPAANQTPLILYFFFADLPFTGASSSAACAAARRATGTRNGEQLT